MICAVHRAKRQPRGDRRRSRTANYDAIRPDLWTHLLFGRGYGTYEPPTDRIVDSEILLRLVETGVLGLLAFLLIPLSVILVARKMASGAIRDGRRGAVWRGRRRLLDRRGDALQRDVASARARRVPVHRRLGRRCRWAWSGAVGRPSRQATGGAPNAAGRRARRSASARPGQGVFGSWLTRGSPRGRPPLI